MATMHLLRTNAAHPDFQRLLPQLDAELAITDGDEHAFYHQYNQTDLIHHVIVAYSGPEAVGCGALKKYTPDTMEVKRMFVLPTARGKQIAAQVLKGLEDWAKELGYQRCILETGVRQLPAIRLYEREGYQRIPNYGQYANAPNSICMEKLL